MRRLTIDMQALIDAMTRPMDLPWTPFIDLRNGSIIDVEVDGEDDDVPDVSSDPERYVEIPRLESHEQYQIMAAFAASVDDDELAERLGDASHGQGAFARFRRVVDRYPDLRERWFDFRRHELMREARRWLASLDVEPVYEALPNAQGPAREAPTTPKIGLVDLLLLGAPDGKTELLDGRVLRQVHARSSSEARSIFVRVARELCWHFDRPWRKRYVEGKSTFDIDRTHLLVDGDVVQLDVEVPTATWKAFS